jgi:hypothetical protein
MRRRGSVAKRKREIDKANIKTLANSMRVQILTILNERANSTTRIATELGVDYGDVAYEIEVLRDLGRIEVVDEVKRRGAVEIFYKATARAHLDKYEWPVVPDSVKGGMRASLLQSIMDDAIVAIYEKTYDSVDVAHMSWTPMILDEEGWEELVVVLHKALEAALSIQERAAGRLTEQDVEGTPCTVSILGYASAQEKAKVGPPTDAESLVKQVKEREAKVKARSTGTAGKKTKMRRAASAKKAPPKGKGRGKKK